jgi:hypothetical protein
MADTDRTVEVPGRRRSIDLATDAGVGRLLLTSRPDHALIPVVFTVIDDRVLIPSDERAIVASEGELAALAVDAVGDDGTEWSLLLTGPARLIDDPVEAHHLAAHVPRSWMPNVATFYVAIAIEGVMARRLPPCVLPPWSGPPLGACRRCGGTSMVPVSDGEMTNFVCISCGACWHVEMGWMSRVSPATCPGCALRTSCTRLHVAAATDDSGHGS